MCKFTHRKSHSFVTKAGHSYVQLSLSLPPPSLSVPGRLKNQTLAGPVRPTNLTNLTFKYLACNLILIPTVIASLTTS